VDDAVDPLSLQRAVQRGEIGEIDLVKGKPPAMRRDQPVQPVLLQADLVIIVEIVDPTTSSPRSSRRCDRVEPMNPATPVTRMRMETPVIAPCDTSRLLSHG